jgi:hypothetical protein
MGGDPIFPVSKLFEAVTLMFSTYAYLSHARRDAAAARRQNAGAQGVSWQSRRSCLPRIFNIWAAALSVLSVAILLVLSM